MTDYIRYGLAILLIVVGIIFSGFSTLGVFRFKYVLNRMHSAAIGDTLAILFVLLGLILISGFGFTSLKLGVIILFFWLAGPISSHLISNLVTAVDRDRVKQTCELIEADEQSEEQEQ